jgi:hypothetical protein
MARRILPEQDEARSLTRDWPRATLPKDEIAEGKR